MTDNTPESALPEQEIETEATTTAEAVESEPIERPNAFECPSFVTLLAEKDFELAQVETEAQQRPTLPPATGLTPTRLAQRISEIEDEIVRNGQEKASPYIERLRMDLRLQEERLAALVALLEREDVDADQPAAVQAKAIDEADRLHEVFSASLRKTLAAQRPIEQGIQSLNAFFLEAACDGSANSVFLINHNPTPSPAALEGNETNLIEMPGDEHGRHPLFDFSSNPDGTHRPITFESIDQMNVIQTMCGAIGLGGELAGQRHCKQWAHRGRVAKSVVFGNVSRDAVGRASKWDPDVVRRLRRDFSEADEDYKHLVTVGNHIVVRRALPEYEDDDVVVYPALPLLGKIYRMEKVDADRSMTTSPVDVDRDSLATDWALGLDCPWIINHRQDLEEQSSVLVDYIGNRIGDDVNRVFSSTKTAYNGPGRSTFELTLGECWLEKLITHFLLTHRGAASTDLEARRMGKKLNALLASMAGERDPNMYFQSARVVFEESRVVDVNGKLRQEHLVEVRFRENMDQFTVTVDAG